MAYRMYDLASQVPGVDPASAINRRDSVAGSLTPTPTPTNTPTETPIPTATAYVPPKPTPLPTPAPPLGTLRGKIVFYSAKEGQEGMWVMNPDGSQKRYLGRVTSKMQQEYDAIRASESYSPDGRYRLYALKDKDDSTVQVYFQGYNQDGYLVTRQVTNCSKICYDPVWAPDGSRIALVSPEWESDDIWVINPDGAEWWNYTPNKWEWEKHPSWSPDSRKIVFWSNREGTKQIYVIDADGRNLKKISGDAPWDEYDPLWIK
jgi:TolB protein